jgi:transcriptional regulator with XRE-family HTH domain
MFLTCEGMTRIACANASRDGYKQSHSTLVMPDLIRHPEALDSGFRRNDGASDNNETVNNSEIPRYDLFMAGRPAKNDRPSFGERLALARQQAGLTQQQLADKLDVTQRVITYWEREPVALRAEQLAALADALGVTTDFLVGRDAPKTRGTGPVGRARRVLETVSRLPRHQQKKIIDVVEAFVSANRNAET